MSLDTYEDYHNHFRPLVSQMDKARLFCRRKLAAGKPVKLVAVMKAGQLTTYWANLAIASAIASEESAA